MGISSGWHDVDKINYGWLPGQLIYIAGRPGSGKTTFAVNTMMNAVHKGHKVWAWLGEQSATEIIRRVAVREARASRVQIQDILNGTVTGEQYGELLLSIPRHERSRLIIDDTPGITLTQMKAETMALKARGQLDLIFVDRIELMSVPGLDGRPDKETAKISYLSTGLKQLARLLDVPLLCCIQLNRKVEERQDKRPQLSDLRMSGSTEQDCDLALMLYRDEYYYPDTTETPNIMEVITRKHRDGRLGTAYLFTDFAAMDLLPARFEQVDLADRVQFNKDRAPLHHGGNDD